MRKPRRNDSQAWQQRLLRSPGPVKIRSEARWWRLRSGVVLGALEGDDKEHLESFYIEKSNEEI
jgi:hypothetical protein